jgi:hypothetical protein
MRILPLYMFLSSRVLEAGEPMYPPNLEHGSGKCAAYIAATFKLHEFCNPSKGACECHDRRSAVFLQPLQKHSQCTSTWEENVAPDILYISTTDSKQSTIPFFCQDDP